MLKLFIQTVLDRVDVVLFEDLEVVATESWISQKDEVKKLLPGIEGMMGVRGGKWEEVREIVVAVGKGNFSSTRIGVTIANVLSMALGARIYEMELDGEEDLKDLLVKVRAIFENGQTVALAKPIYRSEPMISLSKKKKFTE